MAHDLLVSIRTLIKRPGYASSVVATLALGIGASTIVFTLLDAALLRPLPFAEADRLVFLTGVAGPQRSPRGGSFPEVGDWRAMNTTLDEVSMYDKTSLNMRVGDTPIRVETEFVSSSYFPLLGVTAVMGQTFSPEQDRVPDRDAVIVISDALWKDRFGADPGVLQRTVQLNDRTFAIAGVMPKGFSGISFDTDVWVPSMMESLTSASSIYTSRGNRWLGAIGRLKAGVPLRRGQDDLTRVAGILEQQYPDTNRQRGVDVTALRDTLLGNTGPLVIALFGAVLLFLVVACANVASLQLVRATARRRELAVRQALGAGRWHLLRQLLVESLVLSIAAGVAGALVAAWSLPGILAIMPRGALPPHVRPAVDPRTLLFVLAASAAVGAFVCVLAVRAAWRRDVQAALKEGARTAAPGLGSIRRPSTQQLLVVGEIALAMTLLTAAGMTIRSLNALMHVSLGFEPAGVTVAQLTLPPDRFAPPARAAFVEQLSARLQEIPGVRASAIGASLPFTGNVSAAIMLPDYGTRDEHALRYYRNSVTPRYFSTLGIRIVRGRAFTDQDRADTPLVALINESGARRIWGQEDPIGRTFSAGRATGTPIQIVGVVADARFRDLTTNLSDAKIEPDIYLPYAQRAVADIEVAVTSAGGAPVTLASLQEAVSALDAGLPLYRVRRLEDAVQRQTSSERFGTTLLAVFSAGAMLLASVGLYGLIAYVIGLNHKEIAIRLALGADPRQVIRLIVMNGMTLVAVGIVAGIGGALAAGNLIRQQVVATSSANLTTFVAVAALLSAIALVATVLPTRRAVGINPQTALRGE